MSKVSGSKAISTTKSGNTVLKAINTLKGEIEQLPDKLTEAIDTKMASFEKNLAKRLKSTENMLADTSVSSTGSSVGVSKRSGTQATSRVKSTTSGGKSRASSPSKSRRSGSRTGRSSRVKSRKSGTSYLEASTEGSTVSRKSIGSTSTSLATDEKTRRTNKSRAATKKSRNTKTPTGYSSRTSALSAADSRTELERIEQSLVSGGANTQELLERLSSHEQNLDRIKGSLEHNVTARSELIRIYENHQKEDEASLERINKQIRALNSVKDRVKKLQKISEESGAGTVRSKSAATSMRSLSRSRGTGYKSTAMSTKTGSSMASGATSQTATTLNS